MSYQSDWQNALTQLNHEDDLQKILAAVWLLHCAVDTALVNKHLKEIVHESLTH